MVRQRFIQAKSETELSDAPSFTQSPGRGGGPSMARGLRPDSAPGLLDLTSFMSGRPYPAPNVGTMPPAGEQPRNSPAIVSPSLGLTLASVVTGSNDAFFIITPRPAARHPHIPDLIRDLMVERSSDQARG